MKTAVVIMAGGKGERFWPKSRKNLPKQFLSLTDDGKTMIQHTVDRLSPIVNCEDIFIATNDSYVSLVENQLPQIRRENILVEPVGKNTAPCIGFAAAVIKKRYDDAVMIVLPSDHLIKYTEMYIETLKTATDVAIKENNLVTIGITPTYPETGYGYIYFEKTDIYDNCYKVKKFVEKPNIEKAKKYLASGQYLWNSGMFLFKVSSIMSNFKKFMPELYNGLCEIEESVGKSDFDDIVYNCFNNFKSESIDYGIMEKADNIYTIPGNFGWDDVGSWLAIERINKTDNTNNVFNGDIISIDTKNCTVLGNSKLIALAGVENIIVVDTNDALLVCSKNSTQDVKKIIQELKVENRTDLL